MTQRFSADYFRKRAEEARTLADEMYDQTARRMMLDIAVNYDCMAAWAEKAAQHKVSERISN